MSRKLSLLFIAALLFIGHITTFAQSAPVSGTVQLKKADGTLEAVPNALVEVYRVDIKAGFPSAKTNKKGEFTFVGLMLGGQYIFAVSAPGCAPTVFPNVRAGQEKLAIMMSPGDGSKMAEDDARKGAMAAKANSGSGPGSTAPPELTAAEKKAQEEFAKKNAEITEKNKKIQAADETARKSNDEGNAALKAENYDLAIEKFNTGIEAVPDYIGSTPILLNGKIMALKAKGFKSYREGASQPDLEVRKAKFEDANKSYDGALAAFQNAVDILKNGEATTDAAEQKRRDQLKIDLYSVATEIHRLKAVGGVDSTKAGDASTVITAYVAIETNPDKKINAMMALGDIMRVTGDLENAVTAYKKVLDVKPDYGDAMGSLGLCLFAQGAAVSPEDKVKEQEGLNYMQKYTEMSPVTATDSQSVRELKQNVKDTVEYLKSQKMAPQKLPATPKKKP